MLRYTRGEWGRDRSGMDGKKKKKKRHRRGIRNEERKQRIREKESFVFFFFRTNSPRFLSQLIAIVNPA